MLKEEKGSVKRRQKDITRHFYRGNKKGRIKTKYNNNIYDVKMMIIWCENDNNMMIKIAQGPLGS